MSPGVQNSAPKNKSHAKDDARCSDFEEGNGQLYDTSMAAATQWSSPTNSRTNIVRLDSLDELSEELERRTRETQRLQEEVENATRMALEKVGCTYITNSTPPQTFGTSVDCSSDDHSEIQSVRQPTTSQPFTTGQDDLTLAVTTRDVSLSGSYVLRNNMTMDCSQQASELQTHRQRKWERVHLHQAINQLQTKLQEVKMEKETLADLRKKELREHTRVMEEMRGRIRELRNARRSGHKKLQQEQDEATSLRRETESMKHTFKEVYSTMITREKQHGEDCRSSQDTSASPSQLPPAALAVKVLKGLEHENNSLREKLLLATEQLGNGGKIHQREAELMFKEQQERTCAENQAFHQNHFNVMETAVSIHKEKVTSLEQQLERTQAEMEEAQRGRERSLLQAQELESQLSQLRSELCRVREELAQEKAQIRRLQEQISALDSSAEGLRSELEGRSLKAGQLEKLVENLEEERQAQTAGRRRAEEQLSELQGQVSVLQGQLKAAGEEVRRAREEEARLQALLGEKSQEGRQTQALLQKREGELHLRQEEAPRGHARPEEACGQCQALREEAEALMMKLSASEKLVEVLGWQVESGNQTTLQHGRTVDALQQRNSQLTDRLHRLQASLGQQASGLAAMEQDRRRLQASEAEQSRCVQQVMLEKQQLSARVKLKRSQLHKLTEEHKELQKLQIGQREEHEGVVLKLRAQLSSAHAALAQARSNIRTLEGADRHGLQVAMGMQKQITARRDQIDSLQGRVQQLVEEVERLQQEKAYHNLEKQQIVQELFSVRQEKSRLETELETLHSKRRQLKDRVSELEAALDKMSESFANCQDFIQVQEQEFARLKLQHALNLKELKGQNLRTGASVTPPAPVSPVALTLTAPPSALQASRSLVEQSSRTRRQSPGPEPSAPVREVREVRGVISQNSDRLHTSDATSCSSSFPRRRSAPETPCSRSTTEPKLPGATDLEENNLNKFFGKSHGSSVPATVTSFTAFPQLGHRSPVHSLLTSDPNPCLLWARPEAADSITDMQSC